MQGAEVLTREREQLFGRRGRQPALDGKSLVCVIGKAQVELRFQSAVAHDTPRIGGGFRFVHDEQAGSALAYRFFELVGPATVIGHRIAVEQFRVLGGVPGVVHEHDGDLAAHVDAGVIVPLVFRCDDAVTRKHELGVVDPRFGHRALGPDDHVVAEAQRQRAALTLDLQRRIGVRRDLDEGHRLQETVADAGLQAGGAKLLLDVRECFLLARTARRASLEFIRGETFDVRPEGRFRERRRDDGRRDGGRR